MQFDIDGILRYDNGSYYVNDTNNYRPYVGYYVGNISFNDTVSIDYKATNGSDVIAVRNARMLFLDTDDWEDEDSGYQSSMIGQSSTTYFDIVFAPPQFSASALKYFAFGISEMLPNSTTESGYVKLIEKDAPTDYAETIIEPVSVGQIWGHWDFTEETLIASTNYTYRLQQKVSGSSMSTYDNTVTVLQVEAPAPAPSPSPTPTSDFFPFFNAA